MDTSAISEKSDSGGRELAGRRAVVTGASSGIGRAIALELAAGGAEVLVHARSNRRGAEETADGVRAAGGLSHVLLADLAEAELHGQLVDDAWQWRGGVDIWVNNAGADVLTGPAAEWSFEEKLARLWQVDVQATIGLSRLVGRRMHAGQSPGGVILNMGWDQAQWGMEGDSGEMFAAAKGAIMAFSRSLAQSLAPEVRVNCLAPGWIRTEWGQQASSAWQERAAGDSLLGRWGTPEDVAGAARFLAGPRAAFMTGQVLEINGGFRHGIE